MQEPSTQDVRNQALQTPKYTTKQSVAEIVSTVATHQLESLANQLTSHFNLSKLIQRGPHLPSFLLARPHLLAPKLGWCHSGLTSEKACEMGLVGIAKE